MAKFRDVSDVAAWRMCVGCGACEYICPQQQITLIDFVEEGIRPVLAEHPNCLDCQDCLEVCPAWDNDHAALTEREGIIPDLADSCGPVLEIWEGHATDPLIRFQASSGGALTALALYCLEREAMSGVLHIGSSGHDPVRNETRLSRSREELLACTGSRYAPAAACDRLDAIENAERPCVFIGQPAEATALRKAAKIRPRLAKNVGLVLSFFCAGSPSTQGTLDLLKKMGMRREEMEHVRYRGYGWPGNFFASDRKNSAGQISYRESWSFLQSYRPIAVHLFPDGTGEDADISCGDPWYRQPDENNPGSSIIVVRTELGRRLLSRALASGYIEAKPASTAQLLASQRNLLRARSALWGRRLAFRLFGLPVARLRGFALWHSWRLLPLTARARSIIGTALRIIRRKYYLPIRTRRVR